MKRFLCALLLLALLTPCARAESAKKAVALTFDDGPSGKFTERLLSGLRERGVSATFFLCGYRVEQYPQLAARIAREGHEIGSHGDTHRYFTQMSARELCAELSRAQEKIGAACGVSPTLLRPPGGLYDMVALQKTVCAQMPVILWSVDAEDWHRTDIDGIARDIVKQTKEGDIILMHDMSDSSVKAALRAIDLLRAQGYEFVTVSELAAMQGHKLGAGEIYYHFPPNFSQKNASISPRSAQTEP